MANALLAIKFGRLLRSTPKMDWTDREEQLVNDIVLKWNSMMGDFENNTLRFCKIIDEELKTYPDETKKEIIKRVKKHPDINMHLSADRIYQGLRFLREEKRVVKYLEMPKEEREKVPDEDKPLLKRDGNVNVEFYFELRKYNIPEGIRGFMEAQAKSNNWSVQNLIDEIRNYKDEKVDGFELTKKHQRHELLTIINGKVRELRLEELQEVLRLIEGKLNARRTDGQNSKG